MRVNVRTQLRRLGGRRVVRGCAWAVLCVVGLWILGCSAPTNEPAPPRAILDSGGELQAEQAAYNVHHYALDLRVDPEARTIAGHVDVHAAIVHPLEWLVLDLDTTFAIADVEWRTDETWESLGHERRHGQIWAAFPAMRQPGDTVQVRVHYDGAPRVAPNPPWDGGFTWDTTPDGQPWIATSVQTNGADLWWPVKDHPSDKPDSVAIDVRVPDGLTVASNGVLEGETSHGEDSRTFHWFTRQPIATYNVALNIAPYTVLEDQYESTGGVVIPLYFYVLPHRANEAAALFEQAKEHLAFYEELLGPYPFRNEKYGIAHTPHLGMEHQTIIAYGDDFEDHPHGFDWIHHHELGHEWWGNLVSAADWRDFWIHESFCTYMQALYAEHLGGPEVYRAELADYRGQIRNQRPVAPREPHSTADIYFLDGPGSASNHDLYYKGAWVLHTLRWLVGDDVFFDGLRQFAYPTDAHREATDGSQVRFATTRDFQTLMESLHGADLEWFFETYVRQPDVPSLQVDHAGNTLSLRWDQPAGVPFMLPVEVKVDGERQRVSMDNGSATIDLPAGADVEVDPDGWLLRAR